MKKRELPCLSPLSFEIDDMIVNGLRCIDTEVVSSNSNIVIKKITVN